MEGVGGPPVRPFDVEGWEACPRGASARLPGSVGRPAVGTRVFKPLARSVDFHQPQTFVFPLWTTSDPGETPTPAAKPLQETDSRRTTHP